MTKPKKWSIEYEREFEIVFELLKSGDDELALKEAILLLLKYENEPSLHYLVGMIYFKKDMYQKAAKHFRKATVLGPKSEKASLGLFLSLWSLEKQVEALDEMKRYLSSYKSQEYADILKSIMKTIEQKPPNQAL